MALRDPRNKSRNNASRRTNSSTRSRRSSTSAKYNPKPTSSSQRSGKNTGSQRVTQGKGGEVKSPRLKQALDGVKTKRTPAKTPPKTKPVKTNPVSSTPRGAQGPRTAPRQGPYQRPPSAVRSEVPKPKTTPKAPPTQKYKPRVSNVAPQIRQRQSIEQTNQARRVARANPGRTARATRNAKPGRGGLVGALTTGLQIGNAMTNNLPRRATSSNRGAGRATENVRPGPPKKEERAVKGPTQQPKPKPQPKPVEKEPIKAPPKKDSTVLAKKGGKEGVMRNGVFYPTGWSPTQRNRYQIQRKSNTK